MVGSIKEVKETLATKMEIKKQKLEFEKFQQKVGYLKDQREFLMSSGDIEGAKKVNQQLQDLNNSNLWTNLKLNL